MRVPHIIVYLLFEFALILSSGRADEPLDENLVRAATKILAEQSFRKDVAGNEVARNWARRFIALLDSKKMHFLASDENDLLVLEEDIYEDAQNGNFDFAIDTVELLRKRLDVNSTAIHEYLAFEHDYDLDESMLLTYDEYPESENASYERWRKRIKYELLMETQAGMNLAAARKFLAARYDTIQDHYNRLDVSSILAIYLNALAISVDPHSRYFDSKTLALFRTGIVPPVTLGLETAYRDSDLWVENVEDISGTIRRRLIGKRIVAVTAEGMDTIHISGLTPDTAYYTLCSPIGALGFTNQVKVEVDDPRNGDRFSVLLNRFPGRDLD